MSQNSVIGNQRSSVCGIEADQWCAPGRFAAFLAVCILAVYPDVVLATRTFFFRDFGYFGYPLAYYHRQSFWRGEIPLWNPLNNCGLPFLAQWNTLVLYPGSLFYLLLPLSWSLPVFCLLHQFLGGLGMYFLAVRWTGIRLAAAFAGVAYAFNGLMLNSLIWPAIMVAVGWMPWVINSVELAWRSGGRRIHTAAVISAMQMLSGGPEVILFTWALLLALGLAAPWKERPVIMDRLKRFFFVALLVFGICAAQLLPFLDLLKHAQRGSADASTESAMPSWGWANLLVPVFHCYRSSAGVFFQEGQRWTSSYYIGIGTLELASLALLAVKHWRVRLLAGGAILALVLALGDDGFLYRALRYLMPFVGIMNFPVKFMILVTFVVPLLAALAIKELALTKGDRGSSIMVPMTGIGLTLLALVATIVLISYLHPKEEGEWSAVWPNALIRAGMLCLTLFLLHAMRRVSVLRTRQLLGAGLLVALWMDIYTHVPEQNPTVSSAVYESDLQPARKLHPVPKPGETRAMVSLQAIRKFSFHLLADPVAGYIGPRLALYDNCNLLENIPKVDGFFPLYLREEREVRRRLYLTTNSILERVADYMGVSQITTEGTFFEWRPRPSFLPFITSGQKPVFADDATTLSVLMKSDYDPRQAVYLPLDMNPSAGIAIQTQAIVDHQEFANHTVHFSVDAPSPAVVSVAQAYYHCWKAYVDGRPVPVMRANHAFQAVLIPAGRHEVKLAYEDLQHHAGILIAVISLGCVARCYLVSTRKRQTS